MSSFRSMALAVALFASVALATSPDAVTAQADRDLHAIDVPLANPIAVKKPTVSRTLQFGELAEGPYERLVIRGARVIPGHGGPPTGPWDIVIEGNVITEMIPFDPVSAERRRAGIAGIEAGEIARPTGDRVIEAEGMYVMPGMIDLHTHIREEPLPMEWFHYLKLAHGVTTVAPWADRGWAHSLEEGRKSFENEILAPRILQNWDWGWSTDHPDDFLHDPANAPRVAREMIENGAHLIYSGFVGWSPELFGAVCEAAWDAGGITSVHLPPSTNAVVDAVDAARLGVTMIEHHYGYAEAALDRNTQDFPRDYEYNNELKRFRHAGKVWEEANATAKEVLLNEVADSLVAYGVTMLPTRVVYEANRDIVRAQSLPWHEKYTHQALIDWNLPNPAYHGSYHYDWTHDDEQYWYTAFDLWGDLIYEFNKRGGRVAYGTDDNYIWATPGFSNVRELQLLREAGLHTLEVLEAATYNSALTARSPWIGMVAPGYIADLVVVDGSPLRNLRYLYSFGALTLDEAGEMYRTEGIVHTIKDGIVVENDRLMEEVARMVAESKSGLSGRNPVTAPFLVGEGGEDGRR